MRLSPARLDRLVEWDCRCLRHLNRVAGYGPVLALLRAVSRLGDGGIWYGVMAALAIFGNGYERACATTMAISGLIGVAVVHWAKQRAARPRPYRRFGDVRLFARALDEFSFPSGHVLHAVAFSTILCAHYPRLAWVLVPFTALTALSRVVLGLHYPSDVLAGGALGAVIAVSLLLL